MGDIMARIRTVKPEFWSDEQVMECSPLARLMFIGIWNFCDDAGNHPISEKTIKALVFPGDDIDSSTIRRLLVELSTNGLLRFYEISGKTYLNVKGWRHQKIDKPTIKHPDFYEGVEVFPDDIWPTDHVVAESSTNIRRTFDESSPPEGEGEGMGKGKGAESKALRPVHASQRQRKKPAEKSESQIAAASIWESYSGAYFERYRTEPVRNQTVNSQITALVKRIGAEDAPHIAAFFVTMNKRFYVEKLHPVGLLLADCEAIRTQWATNHQVTSTRAGQLDQSQANYDLVNEALAILAQQGGSNGNS